MSIRKAAVLPIALLLVFVAPGSTALAQQLPAPPPESSGPFVPTVENLERYDELVRDEGWEIAPELEEQVLEALLVEIAVLYELDAFRGSGLHELREIHFALAPFPDVGRDGLLDLLASADENLAMAADDLRAELGETTPPPLPAADLLTDLQWDDIEGGVPGALRGEPYVGTLSSILSRGTNHLLASEGLLGAEMMDLPMALDALAGQEMIDDMPASDGSGGAAAADEGRADLVALIAAGTIAGAGVGGLVVFGRRRRPYAGPGTGKGPVADLSELHRRLIGALDEAQVAEIVVSEAVRVCAADAGVLLRPSGAVAVRRAGLADPVEGSRFRLSMDTGQPLLGRLENDPLLAGQAVQAAAVATATAGTVNGVLAVWRHPDHPFDAAARDSLERLAPYVAAALAGADRHVSMTHMALVDGLTSLGNRRRLDQDLSSTLRHAVAAGLPVGFAMVDVDHFKNYNDTHGHGAGDEALRLVAAVIAANVRESDIVYRYGGEEFSILLPGSSPDEAATVAERVRAAVQRATFPGEERQPGGSLTVSVGVATLASSAPDALKARADAALYDAKTNGRNQVVIA